MSRKVKRALWLEQQIEIQENALIKYPMEMMIHSGLLQLLTDEWCELQHKMTDKEELELAKIKGFA